MRDDVTFRVLVSHQYHRSAAIMIRRWCPKLLLFVFYLYSLRFATLHASDSGSGPACQECPNGTFANQSNENCSKCEGGYCNSIDYCSLCLPGTHTEHSGMSICEPCETGSVCNTTGCDRCTKCLAGTAAKNSRVCEPCSVGSYSDVDGSTVCKECSPGLICNITGCDQCTKCLAGTAAKNSSVCDPCSVGSYSNVDGSTVCKECSLGLICNTTGCTHCLPCSAGHQPQAGSSLYSCEPCPPGSYRRNNAGPHLFCVRCQPGWYQVKEGQISCTICPEGHFCPVRHGVITILVHIVSANYCGVYCEFFFSHHS